MPFSYDTWPSAAGRSRRGRCKKRRAADAAYIYARLLLRCRRAQHFEILGDAHTRIWRRIVIEIGRLFSQARAILAGAHTARKDMSFLATLLAGLLFIMP